MSTTPSQLRWTKTYRKPRFTTYIAADRQSFAVGRNRYGVFSAQPVTIGVYVQVGRRVFGVTWAQPHAHRPTPTT